MSDLMMTSTTSGIIKGPHAIVGDNGVVTDAAAIKFHSDDRLGVARGRAAAVVKPATTQEVAAIAKSATPTT